MKRGFTIVELMMAVAIVGILLGLSATAVTGAIRRGRQQQADACVKLVNQGAAVYYAVYGKWPGPMGSKSGQTVSTTGDAEYYSLSKSEVQETVKALVEEAQKGQPVMDISGLFVASTDDDRGSSKRLYGRDFMSAIHGTKKNPDKLKLAKMIFGYPETEHGWFHRFSACYYPKTDRLVIGY